MTLQTIVVLDSGGCTCKAGTVQQAEPRVFPNCTARVKGERQLLVGDAVLGVKDVVSLAVRRPVDRGYVVAWDVQKDIWLRALRQLLQVQPRECGLVLTEPYLNLPALREAALQVVFDELGFQFLVMAPPAALSLRAHAAAYPQLPANAAGCGLVVDSGFSFTHTVPVFDWRVLRQGIRRIDLGGKALTNFMKELVSYRSINMMGEAYLMEHIKDQLCFVSQDTRADLQAARQRQSVHRREYVLPDGVTSTWGHVRPVEEMWQKPKRPEPGAPPPPQETVLVVNNERFMVPEALFHPSDIGMEEAGLAEAIVAAVQAVHPHLHGLLYSNVLLTGGNCRCPGFRERLYTELRPLVPDDYKADAG
ncbi:hypothetical protein N2152v2_010007 [Parachlorella kessleri]